MAMAIRPRTCPGYRVKRIKYIDTKPRLLPINGVTQFILAAINMWFLLMEENLIGNIENNAF